MQATRWSSSIRRRTNSKSGSPSGADLSAVADKQPRINSHTTISILSKVPQSFRPSRTLRRRPFEKLGSDHRSTPHYTTHTEARDHPKMVTSFLTYNKLKWRPRTRCVGIGGKCSRPSWMGGERRCSRGRERVQKSAKAAVTTRELESSEVYAHHRRWGS
jgi:hypothetical protein